MKKFAQRAGAVAALLALAAASQVAHAQAKAGNASTGYAELGYMATAYKSGTLTLRPTAARISGGMDVIPGLAIEGMLATSAKTGTDKVAGVTKEAEISTLAGLYVKPHTEIAPGFELYARAGYVNLAWTTKSGTTSTDHSGNSGSYGVGLSYLVGGKVTLGLDYGSYYNRGGYKLSGATASVGMKF